MWVRLVSSDQLSGTPPRWLPLSTPGLTSAVLWEETFPFQHQPGKQQNQSRLWVWAYLPLSPYRGGPTVQLGYSPCEDRGWEHLLWAVTGAVKGPQPQPGQLLASRCLYCVKPGLGCCWESVGSSIHREIATFCLKLGHEKLVIDRIIASFLIPTAKIQVEEPINLLTETF